jgi:hypothetical protein
MNVIISIYKRNFFNLRSDLIEEVRFRLGYEFTGKEIKEIKESMLYWLSKNQVDHYKVAITYNFTKESIESESKTFSIIISEAAKDIEYKIETDIIVNLIIAKYLKGIVKEKTGFDQNVESVRNIIAQKFKTKRKRLALLSSSMTENLSIIKFEDKKLKKMYEYKINKGILLVRSFVIK